jgi:UDP-2-acetamido-2-deoxy-ribo-hexuluronate aminotransferase
VQFNDLKAQHARHAGQIEKRMQAVLRHAQFIMGPEVAELEQALAERVGVTHCVSVSSGTQALELSLRALGIGPGAEVITTAFSWISSAEVIALVGATPVFVDIEPVAFTLDPRSAQAAITPRTRAILPVSLYGQLPDLSAITAIADAYGLAVIEDGAQSFGAKQRGRSSGSLTRVGCTSFFPSKPLGCYGDGGAIFTSDAELGERLRALRTHGSVDRQEHTLVGTNARLDTLQAAVLLAKLPYFEAELLERKRLAARYSDALATRFATPQILPGNEHVFAQYTLRHPERDALCRSLAEHGIPTQVHYRRGLHQQPVFAHLRASLPETERAAREVFSLPLYPGLADAEQDRVIAALLSALAA